ncbi:hypothetical protein KI809_18695 [Geobacter pelophilus]|uniref:Mu-like prophage I protein n=1 Tax=Geoanaerobacter pelophilus TaxID=60036 RepID=A0AAW4LGR1_9BACT|nr:hypothetical protein [Geoanaerobacter pelophilus]MBT0666341.1 hypothetical protein [Geoanaerobacter pelophilus]
MTDWIEIFKTGTHRDSRGRERTWTTADLDKMVSMYNPSDHEAPMVIGHPKTNDPAFGWAQQLKRVGDKLLALPGQVVPEFAEAVKSGLFKKRSIRVNPDGSLAHIGFLGAMPPAIKGLKDIEFSEGEEFSDYDFNEETQEDHMKTVEQLQKELDEAKKQNEMLQKQSNDFKAQADKSIADFAEEQKKSRRVEITSLVDAGIKDGKILPAWKEKGLVDFMTALEEQSGEYEFCEGKKQSPLDWFKGFISDFSEHPLFKEMVKPEKEEEKKSADFAEDEKLASEMASYVTPQK